MTKIEVQALKLMTRSPIETVQINTPCRFYDEIECAGNATNYSPETEIPVADVAEMGSVRCGEEADLEKS